MVLNVGSCECNAEWTDATALAPSPTADATRFIEPFRTSPTANTPGTEVSKGNGRRANVFHCGPKFLSSIWLSVQMNPLRSVITCGSHVVSGAAPMRQNNARQSVVVDVLVFRWATVTVSSSSLPCN